MKSDLLSSYPPPVVMGGVGGSGTRLFAQYLKELGFFIGNDLNQANDNLWFTLLFRRVEILSASEEEFDHLIEIFFKGVTGSKGLTQKQMDLIDSLASDYRERHPATELGQKASTLLSRIQRLEPSTRWGWKEPNTHVILDRLIKRFPNMKYIHVIRNGLDVAYSNNQNQLRRWGRHFMAEAFDLSPYYSLRFWCMVNRRALEIGQAMGPNFFLLNYDEFCLKPENGLIELGRFLGLEATSIPASSLAGLIRPPQSRDRFRQHDTQIFDKADIAYVKKLGFDIGETDRS